MQRIRSCHIMEGEGSFDGKAFGWYRGKFYLDIRNDLGIRNEEAQTINADYAHALYFMNIKGGNVKKIAGYTMGHMGGDMHY